MGDSRSSDTVIIQAESPDGKLSVVLEDDGDVAYAYLLEEGIVVGDVWLYNVSQSPNTIDWSDPSAI